MKVKFHDLGRINYRDAWLYQEKLLNEGICLKQAEQHPINHLIFCEHNHVYTLGKSGSEQNLLIREEFLKSLGAEFIKTNRGGDITYHGPGQLVGYPVFDLTQFRLGVKAYIEKLEECIIQTLTQFGLKGERLKGATGVWLDANDPLKARKICAIGVRISRQITMHGFAFNINTDLNYFNYINPCGFTDKSVTSLQKELGKRIDIDNVKKLVKFHFAEVFHFSWVD